MQDENVKLSILIKKLRKKENLSQTDMAEKLAIKQSRYRKIENSPCSMRLETLFHIEKILKHKFLILITQLDETESKNGHEYDGNLEADKQQDSPQ